MPWPRSEGEITSLPFTHTRPLEMRRVPSPAPLTSTRVNGAPAPGGTAMLRETVCGGPVARVKLPGPKIANVGSGTLTMRAVTRAPSSPETANWAVSAVVRVTTRLKAPVPVPSSAEPKTSAPLSPTTRLVASSVPSGSPFTTSSTNRRPGVAVAAKLSL